MDAVLAIIAQLIAVAVYAVLGWFIWRKNMLKEWRWNEWASGRVGSTARVHVTSTARQILPAMQQDPSADLEALPVGRATCVAARSVYFV